METDIPAPIAEPPRSRKRSRLLLGIAFVGAGVNHFVMPGAYRRIVPPGMGDPNTLVAVSGVAELAGGVGVLVDTTRRPAGLWLIAVLAAGFAVNLDTASIRRFARIRTGPCTPACHSSR